MTMNSVDEDEVEPFEDFIFDEGLKTWEAIWKDAIDEGLRAWRTKYIKKGSRKTIENVKSGNS